MERKIGEIFNIDNEWYQVVKSNGECCKGCAFYEKGCKAKYADVGSCGTSREDWTQVIFKKLEKVGEPYMLEDKKFQKYSVFHTPYIYKKIDYSWQSFADPYYISLEIKQNKEDMEEKKLNLKPFDIQKAREGKPVFTRDGRKARIICFDAKGGDNPIVALYEDTDGSGVIMEIVEIYHENGKILENSESRKDLMMLPEKKEGWVNIYKSDNGTYYTGAIFYEKNDALVNTAEIEITTGIPRDCIDTVKINWED